MSDKKKKFAPPPAPPLPPADPRSVADASQNAPTRAVSIRKVDAEKKPSPTGTRGEESPAKRASTDDIAKSSDRRGSGSLAGPSTARAPGTPGRRGSMDIPPPPPPGSNMFLNEGGARRGSGSAVPGLSSPTQAPVRRISVNNIPIPPPLPRGSQNEGGARRGSGSAMPGLSSPTQTPARRTSDPNIPIPPPLPRGSKTFQAPLPVPPQPPVPPKSKSSKKKRDKTGGGKIPVPKKVKVKTPSKDQLKSKEKEVRNQLNANLSILISGSETDSEASSIDSDSIQKEIELNEVENVVFDAVTSGSLLTVQEALEKYTFDFNRKNFVGYTILHISVRRQDEEMVKLILEKGSTVIWPSVLKDTLLHAIKEKSTDLVRTILNELDRRGFKIEDKLPQRVMLKDYLENRKLIDEEEEFINSEFHEDISPLMLSAMCDSYDLVELFHDRGHLLQKPPLYILPNKDRPDTNKNDIGPLRASYRLLHYYQACSKPAFLSYRTNHSGTGKEEDKCDPILIAFNLIAQVREEAEKDVFKKEYLEIAQGLEEFTCNLIQQCRRTEEVEELLKQPEGYKQASPFRRLSMAIDMRLKKFVAHRHCQQILYRYWAGKDWPEWRTKSMISFAFHFLYRIIFWPFISIWMCLERSSGMGRMMASPASCFLNNVASYLFFVAFVLTMNVYSRDGPNHRGLPRTGVEYPLLLWVVGFWLSIGKQLVTRTQSYLASPMAWLDITMNTLFLMAYGFWIMTPDVPIDRTHWKKDDPTLIAEILFSIASVLAYGRILRVFELATLIGPMVTAVGQMVYDVMDAMIFFFIIILAFALGLSRLYRPYHDWKDVDFQTKENVTQAEAFTTFPKTVLALYWSIFSMGASADSKIITRTVVSPLNKSEISTSHHSTVENFGTVIYAGYHVVVTLILLNMLLCMMSKTYEAVSGNIGVEWNFARAKIWLSYGMDFVNPSPLNLLPPFASLCAKKEKKKNKKAEDDHYHKLVKKLIQRYFREKAEKAINGPATTESIEALQEDIAEFYSLLEKTDVEQYERQLNKSEAPRSLSPATDLNQKRKQPIKSRRQPRLPLSKYPQSISTLLSDTSAESDAESSGTTSTVVPARRTSQPNIPMPPPPPPPPVPSPWIPSTKIPPQPIIPRIPAGSPSPPLSPASASSSVTLQGRRDSKDVQFQQGTTPSDRSGAETPSKNVQFQQGTTPSDRSDAETP